MGSRVGFTLPSTVTLQLMLTGALTVTEVSIDDT